MFRRTICQTDMLFTLQ